MSINRGMDREVWCIYAMACYLAIKKSKMMPFAAKRLDLEIVRLSEVSQTEKEKHPMTSLICGI